MIDKEELVPLTDEELVQSTSIILAAYGEHFPQLRGKAVSPDRRDAQRHRFAQEMTDRLKASRIVFFKRVTDYPLMMDTGRQMRPK